jgi:hypothetical protein
MAKINYSGYRFPPVIIQQAIWLFVRFTLNFRDAEALYCRSPARAGTRGLFATLQAARPGWPQWGRLGRGDGRTQFSQQPRLIET